MKEVQETIWWRGWNVFYTLNWLTYLSFTKGQKMIAISARLYQTRNLITASMELWSAFATEKGMWDSSTLTTSWRITRLYPQNLTSCARKRSYHWSGTMLSSQTVTWRKSTLRYASRYWPLQDKQTLFEMSCNSLWCSALWSSHNIFGCHATLCPNA